MRPLERMHLKELIVIAGVAGLYRFAILVVGRSFGWRIGISCHFHFSFLLYFCPFKSLIFHKPNLCVSTLKSEQIQYCQ